MGVPIVYITGGSRGIGRALAEACPWPGADIVDVSRGGAAGASRGPATRHVQADLSVPAGWRTVAELLARELPFASDRVAFFHCAGTLTPIGFAGEVDPRGYERSVLLNSAAPQVLGDAFLRSARSAGARCDLVFIGSGAAHSVYEGWTAYGAGKAAVDQWVRTAGSEQARRSGRVRVLSVAPGVVATAMQEEIRRTPATAFPQVERFRALHAEGALRKPEEVAREIWGLVLQDLPNGAVLDLRDLALQGTR
jgi:benzil reductase ((S)-benzoin forming)